MKKYIVLIVITFLSTQSYSTEWQQVRYGLLNGENTLCYSEGIDNPHPAFVDIDNDGDYDMFVGDRFGVISYFRNDTRLVIIWNKSRLFYKFIKSLEWN